MASNGEAGGQCEVSRSQRMFRKAKQLEVQLQGL